MNRSRKALAIGLSAVLLFAGACAKKDDDKKKVVGFIDATSPLSHRFVYAVEGTGTGKLDVQGVVEDDFRYKLQLSLGDVPAVEQIVNDDAVAVRFLESGLVDGFVDRTVADKVDTKTSVDGATVLEALKAKRWVLDEAGAPSSVVQLQDGRSNDVAETTQRDPLFEARTALAYVRRSAQGADGIVRYDPESLNPTYRANEDPFPKPKDGSGVDRYDTFVRDLPSPAAAVSGSSLELPSAANFRKMAVYVKGGRVIAVREFIGLSPRQREDFTKYMQALIDTTAPEDVQAGFRRQVAQLRDSPKELDEFLLGGLNTFIGSAGREHVQFRTMSLELQDFGAVDDQAVLPTETITGDLAVLRNLGRKPLVGADDQGARPAVPQPPASASANDETATTTAGA